MFPDKKPRERAGTGDQALRAYSSALEVWPDYMSAVQGLASLTLLSGDSDARLRDWLEMIALAGEDEAWRGLARGRLR